MLEKHNHDHALKEMRQRSPADQQIFQLAGLFKLFGDTTRMKILYALSGGELCVFEIAELVCMTQSATSHQLKVLKDANLIDSRREGKTIIYFLTDDHVRKIIDCGYEHIMEEK